MHSMEAEKGPSINQVYSLQETIVALEASKMSAETEAQQSEEQLIELQV